jgi:hypothetical protein
VLNSFGLHVTGFDRGEGSLQPFAQERGAGVLHVLEESLFLVATAGVAEIVRQMIVRRLHVLIEALEHGGLTLLIFHFGKRRVSRKRETRIQQLHGIAFKIGHRGGIDGVHLAQRFVAVTHRQKSDCGAYHQHDPKQSDHHRKAGANRQVFQHALSPTKALSSLVPGFTLLKYIDSLSNREGAAVSN